MKRAAAAALAVLSVVGTARAERRKIDPAALCPGCVATVPDAGSPPLVVLLHGDGQRAAWHHAAWERLAADAGFALLALECPKAEGCKSASYWQWNGEASWVARQVEALSRVAPTDPRRRYLVGWSGGASWEGRRAQGFEKEFAAMVFHGGGLPPADDACGTAKTPAYFLVGTANPLHHLAVDLRERLEACGHPVVWDAHRGLDHAAEERLLATRGRALVAWLSEKSLPAPQPTVAPAASSAAAPPLASAEPRPPPREGQVDPPGDPPTPPRAAPTRGCGCALQGRSGGSAGALVALVLAFTSRRRRW